MAGRSKLLTVVLPTIAGLGVVGALFSIPRNTPQRALAEPTRSPPTQPGFTTAHGSALVSETRPPPATSARRASLSLQRKKSR